MSLSEADASSYLALMQGGLEAYELIDRMPDNLPVVKYPRTPGYFPNTDENPLGAWYVKGCIKGASSGPLSGKRIALKDNICVAGMPMMNGASTLEGYVPDVDATIVTRILDAGGEILGKAHCEYFCVSGGSHTMAKTPVQNPRKPGHTPGGSSSGCGALVAAGELEMAMGGDQGGSVRIPAAFCGIYAMKATYGLVPYTGIMPIELTLDHTGPMTATVSDNAQLLEVVAGADGLDPRQYAPKTAKYTDALGGSIKGLRIALIKEGFGLHNSESDVDEKVRQGAKRFSALGATVEEVSMPMHAIGEKIWIPIASEGLTTLMMLGNGYGNNWKGLYVISLLDAHANWRYRANELSDSLKLVMMTGYYFKTRYRGRYYAKAQNQSRRLRAAYDEVLSKFDLLLMPTVPMKAPLIPARNASRELYIQRAFEMIANTAPSNVTGHPAMSIPCGMSDGLPVGLMLIARHFEESMIYRAAHAFEQSDDWRHM
jgi:amidase